MSFSRMKPLPKFVIVGSAVALIVFGAKLALDRVPTKEATPKVVVTQMPAESTSASAPAAAPPVVEVPIPAVPVEPAGGSLTPAGGQDAGLKAVLKAGAK